jgi:hypothetical protein
MAPANRNIRIRFWIETVLAATTGVLGVLTVFWHNWVEAFGFDPDHHNGTVEWLIVGSMMVVALVFAVLARLEWRRTAAVAS